MASKINTDKIARASGSPEFTIPTADGTAGQAIVTNASGVLSFADAGATVTGSTATWIPTITGANALTGTANFTYDGNTLDVKNAGTASSIKLYCESSNAHAQEIKAAPHSGSSSWTLTLPGVVPTVNGQFLSATTAGVASWATVAAATVKYFDSTIVTASSATSTSATFISGGANVTIPAAIVNTLSKVIVVGSGQARFDGGSGANMMKWQIARTAPSAATSNVMTIGMAIGGGTEQYHSYSLFYVDESLTNADHTYEVQFRKDYASTVYYKHGGTNIWVYGV